MKGVTAAVAVLFCLLAFFYVSASVGEHAQIISIVEEDGVLAVYPQQGTNILGNAQYVYAAAGSKLRVTTAHATVTKENLDTGSDTTQTTRDWAHSQGLAGDDAGHILANRLGGSGKDPVNIFPQNVTINRGVYRVFEGHVADCVAGSTGLTAILDWTFSYSSGTDTRPIGVYYCVKYDKTPTCSYQSECKQFTN